MRYIADLHIHSCYSRATSKQSRIPELAVWAAIKGIRVVGTGDFTHPGWLSHLREWLIEAEPGFHRLRRDPLAEIDPRQLPETLRTERVARAAGNVRFVLTAEISSIYKKDGRVRKIHNILLAPGFAATGRINTVLAGIGNLESDGRPILGLDARELLQITLDRGQGAFLVPAHIWTPWFSLFGSKSGFDSLEECFGDLSGEIFALETGLSSDPDMNRCVSALDRYTLISNSDCHSPAKLGREANIFEGEFDFPALKTALRAAEAQDSPARLAATIEFYPEEGKYHCDGHRKCEVCLNPNQTRENQGLCPACGRPVTVGVLHRVMELADRTQPSYHRESPAVHSLIPLPEILGELLDVGANSKKVARVYGRLINEFGSEFNVLLDAELSDLASTASPLLSEAVSRVRQGNVYRQPGYDGRFGVIRVFSPGERQQLAGQMSLFGEESRRRERRGKSLVKKITTKPRTKTARQPSHGHALNPAQKEAVVSSARHILVQAGPGTGKTFTLIQRLLHRLRSSPGPATVLTFTNQAADEVRERLSAAGTRPGLHVDTLHGYCLYHLRRLDPQLRVCGPEMRSVLLERLNPAPAAASLNELDRQVSAFLRNSQCDEQHRDVIRAYLHRLDRAHLIDIEAIVPSLLRRLEQDASFFQETCKRTGDLYVDEFQDLSPVQYRLIRILARQCSVFAIGDPDQAIYGFRGADPEGFFRFHDEMKAKLHTLTMNYRSDRRIVDAAVATIRQNRLQDKEIVPARKEEGLIVLHQCPSPEAEGHWIADRIESLIGGSSHRLIDQLDISHGRFGLADIGILCRTGRQGDVIARILMARGLPVQKVDLLPFYCRKPLLPLYLWCLVAGGQADASHLLQLIEYEKGIGPKRLGQCRDILSQRPEDPLTLLTHASGLPEHIVRVGRWILATRQKIEEMSQEKDPATALALVLDHYRLSQEDREVERFFQFVQGLNQPLARLAAHLLAASRSVIYDARAEAIRLMTLHAAKGTQFPAVFLPGLEDGLLPHLLHHAGDPDLQRDHAAEERRLFYVGITRARHQLFLSWCRQRTVGGKKTAQRISPFLDAIDRDLLVTSRFQGKRKKAQRQLNLFSSS